MSNLRKGEIQMKKVLAFVLSVAMLCSVTACSSKGNSGNGDKTAMTAGT